MVPATQASTGLRIMADAKAIHSKLFVKLDAGDGPKASSNQKLLANKRK